MKTAFNIFLFFWFQFFPFSASFLVFFFFISFEFSVKLQLKWKSRKFNSSAVSNAVSITLHHISFFNLNLNAATLHVCLFLFSSFNLTSSSLIRPIALVKRFSLAFNLTHMHNPKCNIQNMLKREKHSPFVCELNQKFMDFPENAHIGVQI